MLFTAKYHAAVGILDQGCAPNTPKGRGRRPEFEVPRATIHIDLIPSSLRRNFGRARVLGECSCVPPV